MRHIFSTLALTILLGSASAQAAAPLIDTNDIRVKNLDAAISDDGNLMVSMDIDMTGTKIKSNQEYIITPKITDGTNTLSLEPVIFAGRNRYYYHQRNNETAPYLVHNGSGSKNAYVSYRQTVPMQQWMNHSELTYDMALDGCCNNPKGEKPAAAPLAYIDNGPREFVADFVYIPPKAEEVKIRHKSGSAFIDFVVNRTEINADYRNNPRELAKITESIDGVKDDKDLTITKLAIKGFASPEGPYDNNVRLAKGRTQALKDYVRKLYNFPENLMSTSFEAEDWEGLRKFVAGSNLDNKEGILAIIDSDLAPDAKDNKIKQTYPAQYDFLLKNEYPALRHSDYNIEYTVRTYTDVAEIIRVMRSAPQNLSANEFYLAANSFPVGSEEYNEVYEIAVNMYPNDPIINLNAANAAMDSKRYQAAAKYLGRAGDSDEVTYAKGILAALTRDYDKAEQYFNALPGNERARKALQQVRDLRSASPVKVVTSK